MLRSFDRWALLFLLLGFCYETFEVVRWNQRTFYMDKDEQILSAQSLLAGRGLTMRYADPADLSRTDDRPLVAWPPGYSLLIAPLLMATDDVVLAARVLEVLGLAAFFAMSWVWLRSMPELFGPKFRLAVFAWWALVGSPASKMNVSDVWAVALLVLALWCGAKIARRPARSTFPAVLAGIALGSAAAIRFAYWPVAAVLAGGLGVMVLRGRRELLRPLVIHAAVVGLLLVPLAAHQYSAAGRAAHVKRQYPAQTLGFFPQHLARVIPFPTAVAGLYEPFRNATAGLRMPAFAKPAGTAALWLLSLALIGLVLREGRRIWLEDDPPQQAAYFTSAFAGGGSVLLLLTLTLGMSPLMDPPFFGDWVAGQEIRYYAPTFPLFLMALGAWSSRSRLRMPLVFGLAALLGLAPFAIRARRLILASNSTIVNVHRERFEPIWTQLGAQIGQFHGNRVVYIDPDPQHRRMAGLHGAVMADPAELGPDWEQNRNGATVIVAAPD